ncbi:MAG: hypothetical protein IJX88_03420 [Clostridia bacterium]|nr:hypothetical protein [Clostridia bacterium]
MGAFCVVENSSPKFWIITGSREKRPQMGREKTRKAVGVLKLCRGYPLAGNGRYLLSKNYTIFP